MNREPEEVEKSIEGIVRTINSVSIDELDSILQSINSDEALGSMIDPTLWGEGGKFEERRRSLGYLA